MVISKISYIFNNVKQLKKNIMVTSVKLSVVINSLLGQSIEVNTIKSEVTTPQRDSYSIDYWYNMKDEVCGLTFFQNNFFVLITKKDDLFIVRNITPNGTIVKIEREIKIEDLKETLKMFGC